MKPKQVLIPKGETIQLRLWPETIEAIDAWAFEGDTRPETTGRLLRNAWDALNQGHKFAPVQYPEGVPAQRIHYSPEIGPVYDWILGEAESRNQFLGTVLRDLVLQSLQLPKPVEIGTMEEYSEKLRASLDPSTPHLMIDVVPLFLDNISIAKTKQFLITLYGQGQIRLASGSSDEKGVVINKFRYVRLYFN